MIERWGVAARGPLRRGRSGRDAITVVALSCGAFIANAAGNAIAASSRLVFRSIIAIDACHRRGRSIARIVTNVIVEGLTGDGIQEGSIRRTAPSGRSRQLIHGHAMHRQVIQGTSGSRGGVEMHVQ